MDNFTIDPDLESAIPELMPDELDTLEKNILDAGEVYEPLLIWNNTIVDGHNRWSIIQKHPEIKYRTANIDFPDKWSAMAWIELNALGQRNLTDTQKSFLRAQYDEIIKLSHGGDRRSEEFSKDKDCLSNDGKTARQVTAERFGVSEGTIQNDVAMYHGVQAAEAVSPGFKNKVTSGEIKAPKRTLAAIDDIPERMRPEVVRLIESNQVNQANEIIQAELDRQDEEYALANDPVYAAHPNDYNDVLGADSSQCLETFRKHIEDAENILETASKDDYIFSSEGIEIVKRKVDELKDAVQEIIER